MNLTDIMNFFPPELVTAVLSGLPVVELRAGIPFGMQVLHLSAVSAFLWAIIGNAALSILFLYSLQPIESFCVKRLPSCNLIVQRYLARARKSFAGTHAKYGAIGLAIFIAIPLPLTGAWTGAAAAHVMGLPKRITIISMILGIVGAGLIVTFATLGLIRIF
ncbi:MAG: small multi-drug export protein [bacterium]